VHHPTGHARAAHRATLALRRDASYDLGYRRLMMSNTPMEVSRGH
jgi:hypothetical protein